MKLLSCIACLLIVLSGILIPSIAQGEELDTLLQEARTAASAGAFRGALEKVSEAQQPFSEGLEDTPEERGSVWDTFLDVYIELKQDEMALLELRPQVLALIEQIGVQDGSAGSILHDIGKSYEDDGQYDIALQCYQRTWEIETLLEDENADLHAMYSIGTLYEKQRQYDKALKLYQEQRAQHKKSGNTAMEIQALHKVVYAYHMLPNYEKALEIEREVLALQKKNGTSADIGITLARIGSLYELLGQYENALESHRQAINLYKEQKDTQGYSDTAREMEMMAYIYRDLGLHNKAIALQEEAVELWSKTEAADHVLPYSLIQLARSYQMSEQYEQAQDILQQALERAQIKRSAICNPSNKPWQSFPKEQKRRNSN